ncbi:MAG: hypothetical protein KKA42_09955 [candidate division Zixibacteria bacterium]|nr:hypothetical protein [candidate division Zixibacteria bacterium]
MEILIWLKRALPFVVLGLIWLGYNLFDTYHTKRQVAEEKRIALITAQTWIGTARYRNDPERFLTWRDSLLQAHGITRGELDEFLTNHESEQEEFMSFVNRVKLYVDSLAIIEDSLISIQPPEPADSVITPPDSTV